MATTDSTTDVTRDDARRALKRMERSTGTDVTSNGRLEWGVDWFMNLARRSNVSKDAPEFEDVAKEVWETVLV